MCEEVCEGNIVSTVNEDGANCDRRSSSRAKEQTQRSTGFVVGAVRSVRSAHIRLGSVRGGSMVGSIDHHLVLCFVVG